MRQVWIQAQAVLTALIWSGVVAFVCFKVVDMTIGLRVPEEEEREGLDTSQPRRAGLQHLTVHDPSHTRVISQGAHGRPFLSWVMRSERQ